MADFRYDPLGDSETNVRFVAILGEVDGVVSCLLVTWPSVSDVKPVTYYA